MVLKSRVLTIYLSDTTHAVDNNNAVKTFIATNGVGAIAEDKSGEILLLSKEVSVGNIGGVFYFQNIARWATKAHGGKAGD